MSPQARPFFLSAFDETQHLAHVDGFRAAGQQVAPLGASTRFHKPALFQAGEDEFKKFLRDLLASCNVGDPHRILARL